MTTKTITLDHAVAERMSKAIEQDKLFKYNDLQALHAALAKPVPLAGGVAEVLGYLDHASTYYPSLESVAQYGQGRNVRELVDRDHVTRLQAEVEQWKQGAKVEADAADEARGELAAIKDECIDHVNLYKAWTKERDTLQSELTKARELLVCSSSLVYALNSPNMPNMSNMSSELLNAIDAFFSNQSAPALIETLRANGDRIAMEATIAQQAQRIADLESGKGQGEPVAVGAHKLEMAQVVRAHMEISGCPVLTSNQCHTLAMKLNACLDEVARLNGVKP